MASLSQGRTAAAQCGFFTYKSVPVIFEPPCTFYDRCFVLQWLCKLGGLKLETKTYAFMDGSNIASLESKIRIRNHSWTLQHDGHEHYLALTCCVHVHREALLQPAVGAPVAARFINHTIPFPS